MLIIMMMIMIAMMMTLDFERCVSAPWPQAGQQTNWPRHHFHLGEPGRPSTYHHMKGELRDPTHHPKDDSFGITFTFLSVSHVLAFSPESELKDPPTIKMWELWHHLHKKSLSYQTTFTFLCHHCQLRRTKEVKQLSPSENVPHHQKDDTEQTFYTGRAKKMKHISSYREWETKHTSGDQSGYQGKV